jgi:hypothetical protein
MRKRIRWPLTLRGQVIATTILTVIVWYASRKLFGAAWGWRLGGATAIAPIVGSWIGFYGNQVLAQYDHPFKSH